jgi:predicted nicotinamide N-methyase
MTNRPAPQATGAFIRANLRAGPVPMLPDIRTYQAHPASGLARIGGAAPYWAYV